MGLTQRGNRVYARITDLSEEASIKDGDKLIFQSSTTNTAAIIDYSNFKIDLEHTSFQSQFEEMLNFARNAGAWSSQLTTSFEELQTRMDEVTERSNEISNDLEALKMLVKMMLGLVAVRMDGQPNYNEQQFLDSLSDEIRTAYNTLKQDVVGNNGYGDIDFTRQNILYISTIAEDSTSSSDQDSP